MMKCNKERKGERKNKTKKENGDVRGKGIKTNERGGLKRREKGWVGGGKRNRRETNRKGWRH